MPEYDSTTEFRPVQGHPGYMVGSDGSVWSERNRKSLGRGRGTASIRTGVWRQLKPGLAGGRSGTATRPAAKYYAFSADRKTVPVHVAVLTAFVGPCPPGMECRHLNGNPLDNRLENLAWGTSTQNNRDRNGHGTMPRGERNPNAKLTARQVARIRELVASGLSYKAVAAQFGVHQNTVRYVVIGYTW